MKIVDLSAGNRAVWYNKRHPDTVYLDIRPGVEPDIVCDTRSLPDLGPVDLFCFDPPHCNTGKNSDMSKRYGHHTTAEILDTIEKTGKEAHRVAAPNALMALKWNTHDIRLQRVFDLLPDWEPLFGHLTKDGSTSKSQTYWVMLRARPPV